MGVPEKIGGWMEDPPGASDKSFSELAPKLVKADGDVDLEPWCTEVSDQLTLSSCVANASADAYELCNGLELAQAEAVRRGIPDAVAAGFSLADSGKEVTQISRLQIYFNGRSRTAGPGVRSKSGIDGGMPISAAFDAMMKIGVCPESMWPYEPSKVNWRPSVSATWYALRHKIEDFYRIGEKRDSTAGDVRKAVRGRHPVVFSIPVTDAFRAAGEDPVPAPSGGDKVHGFHAIVAVGTDGDAVKIRNSWGADWGVRGYALLDQEWFLDHARSLFVPTKGVLFHK